MGSRSPAARRFLRRVAIASGAYVVTVFFTLHIFRRGPLHLPEAIGVAIVPSLPILAVIAIVGLYLKEETDEFKREIFIQSLLWGSGLTLALTSFWSFLHLFAHVPGVDGFHVFAMFWIFVAISAFPLARYYGGSDE